MIVSRTTKLTFNISLSGTDIGKTLVKNLGSIRKLVMKLEGNEIISNDNCDILYSYYDCWKRTTERRNVVFQGVVEVGGQRKMLSNTGQMLVIKQIMQKIKQWHQFLRIDFAFH